MTRHGKSHKKECKKECFDTVHADKLCAKKATIKEIKTTKITLNGADVECLIGRPGVANVKTPYDCLDCDGNPIKPDNIDQDIWDFLECNRKAYQQQIQEDLLEGRENIRCIRQAYGCAPACPFDCPPPSTCAPVFVGSISGDVLTVTSLSPDTGLLAANQTISNHIAGEHTVVPGTTIVEQLSGTPGEEGTYKVSVAQTVAPGTEMVATIPCPSFPDDCGLIPPSCLPNPDNCSLAVQNLLYRTQTLPFYFYRENTCGGVNQEGFPYGQTRLLTAMSYNLDINNLTCNLATRVVSVLIHYAYKKRVEPTPPPESECPVCPGVVPPEGLPCLCLQGEQTEEIICGVVRINCRQLGATININIGENFSNVVNIPSEIIQAMIASTSLPLDPNNVTGAFQMAIFIEEGLQVSTNFTVRGGGGGGFDDGPTSSNTGCFNGEAKVLLANGEMKMAKDIQVGDKVATLNGETEIVAKYVQKEGEKELVQISDLIISHPHRVLYEGKWVKPAQIPSAEIISSDIPVYNFITKERVPIIVEGMILSTVGMYCEGSHDMNKPLHRLWASEKIVELFSHHPQYPNIELENDDIFLKMIKSEKFAKAYLAENEPELIVDIPHRSEILC